MCAPAFAQSGSADQEACAAKLKTIDKGNPAFQRLDTIYRQSLRFGGTAHRIVPHWHATHKDLEVAKNTLTVEDIPYMVRQVAQVDTPDARQRVAVGVLGLFGLQALPCIEAALEDPDIKGRLTLQQLKIQIAVDRPSTSLRDDVAAYIHAQFTAPAERTAAAQVAMSLQATLLVKPGDTAAARVASRRVAEAINCVYARFPITGSMLPGNVVTDMEALVINTRQRKLAYRSYNQALDGTTSALPEGETCEQR